MVKKLIVFLFVFLLGFSSHSLAGEIDFGDGSSKTLTTKAWTVLQIKEWDSVEAFTDKCVKKYSKKALEQQATLTGFPPKDEAVNYWALNDVATCLYIKGKALKLQGENEEAKDVFNNIIKNYSYAQAWDEGGFFWSIANAAKDEITGIEFGVDFGDMKSSTLTSKAWKALNDTQFKQAEIYVEKCIFMYDKKAGEMQASLKSFPSKDKTFDYWALNDVGTCLFIKGKTLREQKKDEDAQKIFQNIIDNYGYAQCWDPGGFFWKVADASKDQIEGMKSGVDFGNMKSNTFASKAWEALKSSHHDQVDIFVNKCMAMYGKKAKEQQASLKTFASKEKAFDYWALNDVGTCLFIKGKSLANQGKEKEAKKIYQDIIQNYTFAQCWDPQGWFWQVSEAARDQIITMETGIDFGDYTSETLVTKAWESLGTGDYDAIIVYTRKCVNLYRKQANEQQASLSGFAPKEKAFDYWALNDVGTAFFIMGEAYVKKEELQKALEAYKTLVDQYPHAQCWDPKGWFWKPAVAARGKINKLAAEQGLMY